MLSDEQRALALQRGEKDNLTALIEAHYEALLGYVYRLNNGDRALAQDLVQEVFMQVSRMIAQYEYPRPFKTWLYAIATNLLRNHYQRAETRHTVATDLSEFENHRADESTEGSVIARDEARQVIGLLNKLPVHQREVVILRYYEELSLAEIAETLNIPVGTVKSRLSLGLVRLRTLMEPAGQ